MSRYANNDWTVPRTLGVGLLAGLCALIGLWIAALTLLPDAPHGKGVSLAVPAASVSRAEGVVPPTTATALVMPVRGIPREGLRDSWGDPRDNGARAHHGTDIMAAPNMPVVAAAAGTVEKLWTSAAGGTTLYVRSPGRDWVYYYAHLSGYAPGVHEGQVVKAGDLLGFVGDTGNAGAGNYHLHFGMARTAPGQRWYQGEDVDPFPYLTGQHLAGNPGAR